MLQVLSTAAPPSTSDTSTYFILICAGVLAVVCVLTFTIIYFSRARRHRHIELLTTASFFWGILAAGVLIRTAYQQVNWSQQNEINLSTGYLLPGDAAASQPPLPLLVGGILAVVYIVILTVTFLGKPKDRPDA